MVGSRGVRRSSLVLVAVLFAALVVPASVFANDWIPPDGIIFEGPPISFIMAPSGGKQVINPKLSFSWPAGAVAASTEISVTPGASVAGVVASDGGKVYYVASFEPRATQFSVPVSMEFVWPPALINPRMYAYDTNTGRWNHIDSVRSGATLTASVSRFGYYGVGGDVPPPTSTPASSDWSLGLLAVAGLGVVILIGRKVRTT